MTTSYVERELKFDVDRQFVVPDLAGLLPSGGRTEISTERLRSDYFDTPDHALLRANVTLRRRNGTTDVGWQLKVPYEQFREEVRVDDVGGDSVPAELAALVVGIGQGQSLSQIASVTTERSATRLVDADGQVLAEIDDDTVHASAGGEAATLTSWREVEVELGGDAAHLLQAVGKRLRRAGARPSASSSKLARALTSPPAKPGDSRRKARAADIVLAYLAEQQRTILAGDLALRRGDDSVIHPTRVATRRLRSTLRVFSTLFDPDRAATLDGELRWYAALLGAVRDRQVLHKRFDAMVAAVDDTLLMGPVRARVETELRTERTEHWDALLEQLSGQRYLNLLTDIDSWVQRPPLTRAARRRPALIATLVRRAERRVSRRLRQANAAGDVHLLHGARKAAKRARYAAEAAQPVIGKTAAARAAKRYQKLQDLLGEHQDSLVSADLLRRLGAKAGSTSGENGFAFGVLHEREAHNAEAARKKAQRVAHKYR